MDNSATTPTNCGVPSCKLQKKHGHLVRYTFKLPDALDISDGYTSTQIYPPLSVGDESTFAHVTIRQVEIAGNSEVELAMECAAVVHRGTKAIDSANGIPAPKQLYSVAQIITLSNSPDEPPTNWNGKVQNLEPRQDAFMRALHAVYTVARAAKLHNEFGPIPKLPSYERTPFIILVDDLVLEDEVNLESLGELNWSNPSFMFLEHGNLPGRNTIASSDFEVSEWVRHITAGLPQVLAREYLLDSKRLINQEGQYGAAIAAAATSIEVLCTSLVSSILWEKCLQSAENDWKSALTHAATREIFRERIVRNAQVFLQTHLGGNWSSDSSEWQIYRRKVPSLRGRIVHAGFLPSRQEAEDALQTAMDAHTFVYSQLANKRNQFPRTCWLFIGREGLVRRKLFSGKIKHFYETIAPQESDYVTLFANWHHALVNKSNE